ncbi:hypothetical protein JMJ77_0002423 [Colletotrichum scovillei]|uniref:Uncharacterized protein n=1 Tax=Colletotrichum scovillei TaxID=1209932 RepID=A0A9P7R7V5_9PEZI|nr:hypothetical protein JMJ77_0002423 [Colletotrichum scovillei]KAG7070842.1 hypothetical protein JMJ76_0002087 [Colletotrichum scovillei]KAG7079106.1 hypothetical protein JMJ78_0002767 [Colletotrichum scovillei]
MLYPSHTRAGETSTTRGGLLSSELLKMW